MIGLCPSWVADRAHPDLCGFCSWPGVAARSYCERGGCRSAVWRLVSPISPERFTVLRHLAAEVGVSAVVRREPGPSGVVFRIEFERFSDSAAEAAARRGAASWRALARASARGGAR